MCVWTGFTRPRCHPPVQDYCLCQLEKPFYHAENGVCCKLLTWKTAVCLACAMEPPKRWFSFFPEGKAAPLRERPVRPAGCVVLGLPPTHPHNMDLGLFPRVFEEGCVSDVFNQSSWKCSHGISLTPSPAMPGLLCFQTLLSQQQFRVSFLSEAPLFCILEPPLMH